MISRVSLKSQEEFVNEPSDAPQPAGTSPAAVNDNYALLPSRDDWEGWVDLLIREDDGTINCVPPVMRFLVEDHVGDDGRLNVKGMVPSTPYGVAKFMLSAFPLPWRGTGMRPSIVKHLMDEGFTNDIILAAGMEVQKEVSDFSPFDGPASESDLYVIASESGPIKIGISTNPEKRLQGLQTGHPYKLSLLLVVPGGGGLESYYHKLFAEHRLIGEWFHPAPEIMAEIDRLNAMDQA